MRIRSSPLAILLVACRAKHSSASARSMPDPLSVTRMAKMPPFSISTVMAVAPASIAFSTSSLITEAGRSTTSPAAMRLAVAKSSVQSPLTPPLRAFAAAQGVDGVQGRHGVQIQLFEFLDNLLFRGMEQVDLQGSARRACSMTSPTAGAVDIRGTPDGRVFYAPGRRPPRAGRPAGGHLDAEALVRTAPGDLAQKDNLVAVLFDGDAVIFHADKLALQPREPHDSGWRKGSCPGHGRADTHHRPGDG